MILFLGYYSNIIREKYKRIYNNFFSKFYKQFFLPCLSNNVGFCSELSIVLIEIKKVHIRFYGISRFVPVILYI